MNNDNIFPIILPPGIGDQIYQWYKLIRLVKEGTKFSVYTTGHNPRRSHQMLGCLEGMISFDYLNEIDFAPYILKQVYDPRRPTPDILYEGIPVLHINSFLEHNKNIEEFMPAYPCDYEIELKTNAESKEWAKNKLDKNNFNIVLYCSNYENNKNCNVQPNPEFWAELAILCYGWQAPNKSLKIFTIGASYDANLTEHTTAKLLEMGYDVELLLDQDFYNIIDLIRNSDFVATYESGMGMIADVTKTPCLEIFRCQGDTRDDKIFPYLGPINPMGIGKRFFPFFYDDEIKDIRRKLK